MFRVKREGSRGLVNRKEKRREKKVEKWGEEKKERKLIMQDQGKKGWQ